MLSAGLFPSSPSFPSDHCVEPQAGSREHEIHRRSNNGMKVESQGFVVNVSHNGSHFTLRLRYGVMVSSQGREVSRNPVSVVLTPYMTAQPRLRFHFFARSTRTENPP